MKNSFAINATRCKRISLILFSAPKFDKNIATQDFIEITIGLIRFLISRIF